MKNDNHNCRVCGKYFVEEPWQDGMYPSFDICPCCGVEFGNEDLTVESTKDYRNKWLSSGATWNDPKQKPIGWEVDRQLAQVPIQFK